MAAIAFKGGDKMQSVLEKMKDRLGKAQKLDVGFMEGATYPDGTPVAMVAAIHNYGAPAAHIPARPFFSDMVRDNSPQWGEKMGKILAATGYDAEQTMGLMGEKLTSELQDSIRDSKWAPLADSTVSSKGFDKALIDTGHMLNSVQYAVDGDVKQ